MTKKEILVEDLPDTALGDLSIFNKSQLTKQYRLMSIEEKGVYRYWLDLGKDLETEPLQAARFALGRVLKHRRKQAMRDVLSLKNTVGMTIK